MLELIDGESFKGGIVITIPEGDTLVAAAVEFSNEYHISLYRFSTVNNTLIPGNAPGSYFFQFSDQMTLDKKGKGDWQVEIQTQLLGVRKSKPNKWIIETAAARRKRTDAPVYSEVLDVLFPFVFDVTTTQLPAWVEKVVLFDSLRAEEAAEIAVEAKQDTEDLYNETLVAKNIAVTKASEALTSADNAHTSELNAAQSKTQAQAYAEAVQAEVMSPVPWDVAANSAIHPTTKLPVTITANSTAFPEGTVLLATVAGNAGFAGTNFNSGQVFKIGDQLRKIGTQWFRGPFVLSDGSVSVSKLEAKLAEVMALLTGILMPDKEFAFRFADKFGNVGLSLTRKAVLNAFQIITNTINGVKFTSTKDYFLLMLDRLYNIGFSVDYFGRTKTIELEAGKIKIKGSDVYLTNDGAGGLAFKNINTEKTAIGINKAGTTKAADLEVSVGKQDRYLTTYSDKQGNIFKGLNKAGVPIGAADWYNRKIRYGLRGTMNAIIVDGQSLSQGGSSGPALSTTGRYAQSHRFVGGLRITDMTNPQISRGSLVTLDEVGQESPCSGISEALWQGLLSEGDTYSDTHFLFSCPGQSDTKIEDLSKIIMEDGSYAAPYQRKLWDVEYGMKCAHAMNLSYNVFSVVLIQGEANALDKAWKEKFRKYKTDLNRDIKAITGQTNNVIFITYQTASVNGFTVGEQPTISYQQFEAVEDPYISDTFLGDTMYDKVYQSDKVHLPNIESKKMGAKIGHFMYKLICKEQSVTHITLNEARIQGGRILELEYLAPTYPLRFDTVNIVDPGNKGFRLYSPVNGHEIPIGNVSIVRGNTIVINANEDLLPGTIMTYAVKGIPGQSGKTQGSRGCVCDGEDFVFDNNGTPINLRYYMPIQTITF